MARALGETEILGIANNVAFFRQLLRDPDFQTGNLHTGFLKTFAYTPDTTLTDAELDAAIAILANAEALPAAATSTAIRSHWSRR